jgi:hypothetical protein
MEYVRSAKLSIEVDTNKQTYQLDLDDVEVDEIETAVSDFIRNLRR